jgi:hypothetical protein
MGARAAGRSVALGSVAGALSGVCTAQAPPMIATQTKGHFIGSRSIPAWRWRARESVPPPAMTLEFRVLPVCFASRREATRAVSLLVWLALERHFRATSKRTMVPST